MRRRGAQPLGQAGVAGEDDAEELTAVEILGGEDAQLVEDGGLGLLGLVEDQHRAEQGLRNVLGPAGAQRLEAGPAVLPGERDATLPGELVGLDDPAGQHRTTGIEPLSHDLQAVRQDGRTSPGQGARR